MHHLATTKRVLQCGASRCPVYVALSFSVWQRDSVQTRVVHTCIPLLWASMSSVESDPREALSRLPRDAAFCLSGRVALDYLSGAALARELFEVLCTVLEVRGALVGR